MTVYVDRAVPYGLAVADSAEELEALRAAAGGWMFAPPDPSRPIRTVSPSGRDALVRAGAVAVGDFACGTMFAYWERHGRMAPPAEALAWREGLRAMDRIIRAQEEPLW